MLGSGKTVICILSSFLHSFNPSCLDRTQGELKKNGDIIDTMAVNS
jgi:hypothetical protein